MSNQYYYNINNTQQGPIAKDELLKLYQKGEIVNETPIWIFGYPHWQLLLNTELYEEFNQSILPPQISNLPPPLKLPVIEAKKPEFLSENEYIIENYSDWFDEAKEYQILNEQQSLIGRIHKIKYKSFSIFYDKTQQAFAYEIKDNNNEVLAILTRERSLTMANIKIQNGQRKDIGYIQPTFKLSKFVAIYKIYNQSSKEHFAEIEVNWKAWDYKIQNPGNVEMGSINKIYTGLKDQLLTNAEKYGIRIDNEKVSTENKLLLISSAIIVYIVSRWNVRI